MRTVAALLLTCMAAPAAEVRGTVIQAFDRRPLKRAEVVLRPAEGGQARGTTTDDLGRFAFHEVPSAAYRLEVSRPGFVSSSAVWQNDTRLPGAIEIDKDTDGLVIRLIPTGTISGKVRHQDGEPAARIGVEAWREYWVRNRHLYEMVRAASTDDRGEYRLYGLPPGRYFIAAVSVPFRGNDDVDEQWVRDASGILTPPERAVTTFLPSSWKLSDAGHVQVFPGAEVGNADIFLARARIGKITGKITHGRTGELVTGANIRLMREDGSGSGFLSAQHFPVRSHARGEFTILGVVPGSYVLEVRGTEKGGLLFSRQIVTMGNSPQVSVNVLLQPDVILSGQANIPSRDGRIPAGLRLIAEPRGDGLRAASAAVARSGTFELRITAGVTYDLVLANASENVYLRAANLSGEDVLKNGLRVESSTMVPLTLTVDTLGAAVRGQTQPGANVTLIPSDGLLARFQDSVASGWGVFQFQGVAPGEYRVVSWFEEPPCDVWNPERRGECMRFGQALRVQEASSHTLSLEP